jgi:hypothetical protein
MSAQTFLTVMKSQEANITRNPFNPQEQRNDKVQFFEVMREKAIAEKHQIEKVQNDKLREERHIRNQAAQDFMSAKHAEKAEAKRQALKDSASEAAEEYNRTKADSNDINSADAIDNNDEVPKTFEGLFGDVQTRAVNDRTAQNGEQNALDHTVSVQSNPLNTAQLETGNLDQDTLNFLKNLNALSGDGLSVINTTLNTQFGAFDTPESLFISNTLGLSSSGTQAGTLDGFLQNLGALYHAQDPAATLSNLTPQQVSELQRTAAGENAPLFAENDTTNTAEILDALLNLQNVKAANAEAENIFQSLQAQTAVQTSPLANTLNLQIHDDIAGIISQMISLVPPETRANIAQNQISGTQITDLQAQQAAVAASQNADNDAGLLQKAILPPTDAMISKAGDGENTYNMAMERANAQANVTANVTAEAQSRMEHAAQLSERRETLNIPQHAAPNTENSAKLAAGIAQSMANNAGLLFPTLGQDGFADQLNLIAGQGQSTTQSISLTNLLTNSQHAGQSHPATQMVAATIQKSAGPNGLPKHITLQLDPPELGRVEVKMSFDQDSTIKAVVIVEKPETHLMMQRDAQVLERALQDAGLDAEGGLSFELASDGHDFNQDQGHDGSHHGSDGASDGTDEDRDLTESTMTWHVDDNTGHTHYSILA